MREKLLTMFLLALFAMPVVLQNYAHAQDAKAIPALDGGSTKTDAKAGAVAPTTVTPQPLPTPDSMDDLLKSLVDAAKSGKWFAAAALALMLLLGALKKFLGSKIPDTVMKILTFALPAVAGALAAKSAGAGVGELLLAGLGVGVAVGMPASGLLTGAGKFVTLLKKKEDPSTPPPTPPDASSH